MRKFTNTVNYSSPPLPFPLYWQKNNCQKNLIFKLKAYFFLLIFIMTSNKYYVQNKVEWTHFKKQQCSIDFLIFKVYKDCIYVKPNHWLSSSMNWCFLYTLAVFQWGPQNDPSDSFAKHNLLLCSLPITGWSTRLASGDLAKNQ